MICDFLSGTIKPSTTGEMVMELNKQKTELIRKLIDARLTKDEREQVISKAKEIIERDKLEYHKPKIIKI